MGRQHRMHFIALKTRLKVRVNTYARNSCNKMHLNAARFDRLKSTMNVSWQGFQPDVRRAERGITLRCNREITSDILRLADMSRLN
jgi:hypothetical protein